MPNKIAFPFFCEGLTNFMARNSFTLENVGDMLGCSRVNIHNLRKGRIAPTFGIVCGLLEHGMTLEEMFGPELARKLVSQSQPSKPPIPESPLEKARFVRAGLKELLAQLTELDARLPDVPEDK